MPTLRPQDQTTRGHATRHLRLKEATQGRHQALITTNTTNHHTSQQTTQAKRTANNTSISSSQSKQDLQQQHSNRYTSHTQDRDHLKTNNRKTTSAATPTKDKDRSAKGVKEMQDLPSTKNALNRNPQRNQGSRPTRSKHRSHQVQLHVRPRLQGQVLQQQDTTGQSTTTAQQESQATHRTLDVFAVSTYKSSTPGATLPTADASTPTPGASYTLYSRVPPSASVVISIPDSSTGTHDYTVFSDSTKVGTYPPGPNSALVVDAESVYNEVSHGASARITNLVSAPAFTPTLQVVSVRPLKL